MIAIVVSRADSASEHIGTQLLELVDWDAHVDDSRPDADGGGTYYRTPGFELREFDDLHIYLDDPAAAFGCDTADSGAFDSADTRAPAGDLEDCPPAAEHPNFLVFVSRHSGETGPLLTAHATGNFGPADYGGHPNAFARSAPGAQKRVVAALDRHAPDEYDVCIECTHHGPTTVSVPSLFVEVGSDEPQWADPDAAQAVAQAVLDLRGTGSDLVGDDGRTRHVVGFGGGHYAPRFSRIVRETDWAVGHVGADWGLEALGAPAANRNIIDQAFSMSRAEHAVIEGSRPDLETVIRDLGHRVVGETWVREVGDRPLELVELLEATIASVADGLRFGDVVPETVGGSDVTRDDLKAVITVWPLPAELLARAQGIDGDAAREAVAGQTIAFETEQAGTRAIGDAAFVAAADGRTPGGYDDLVAALATILETAYDEVTIADDTVVARTDAFDPSLAAEQGVPEGPAFGRLASGEAVEVDGETITPATVSRRTADRFPIRSPPSTE